MDLARAAAPSGPTRWLSYGRWAFMPLGLCALVAVGAHAAADTVDAKLLWAIDSLQAQWDAFWTSWSWGTHLASPLGLSARTQVARGVTLVWELGADLVLALPMLRYREVGSGEPLRIAEVLAAQRQSLRAVAERVRRRPSTLTLSRAPLTALIALAGACALARLVEGTVYVGLHGETLESAASAWSRFAAIVALGLVCVTLGWRATLQSLASADAASEGRPASERWTAGLLGTLWVLPLALAAALDASPVLSFFR
jgi:hypothetical protein